MTITEATQAMGMVVFMCMLVATVSLISVMQHHEERRRSDWRDGMTFVALAHGGLLLCGLVLFMGWSAGARPRSRPAM